MDSMRVLHAIPHIGLSVSDPYTILVNISREIVAYRLTTTIIELRRFTGFHKAMVSTIRILAQGFPMNGPQSTKADATTLKPQISISLSLTFPSKGALCFPLISRPVSN
jgi:hypothetical protein